MKQDLFEKYPIPKAVMTLAIPTMLSMLVTIVYNMADTFLLVKRVTQTRLQRLP